MNNSFYKLEPKVILAAIEQAGFVPTGELLQLNSYENRVYDIRLEEPYEDFGSRVIAKFYRPGRWPVEALHDEHAFLRELDQEGIPVNIPLELRHGDTVGEIEGLFFSLFPKHRGRLVDEFLRDDLSQVGRLIARLHNVGARHPANHRLTYDAHYIEQSLDIIERFIDPNLWSAYCESSEWLLEKYDQEFPADNFIRIHGDCHRGNLLKNETGFFLVDFDDFCNGPVGQDFWMLMSSCESENSEEKERLLSGYRELRALPEPEVNNLELLRAMRIIHYAAWIGRRWQDPFFPQIFPNYTSTGYWNEDLHALQSIIHRIT